MVRTVVFLNVSPKANWNLYNSQSLDDETSRIIDLSDYAEKTVTKYIHVIAEDGVHNKWYSISIYRQSITDTPIIHVKDGYATISSEKDSIIRYTINDLAPTMYSGTEYAGPFAVTNGSVIKAIAKAAGKDEASEIATVTAGADESVNISGTVTKQSEDNTYSYNIDLSCINPIRGQLVIALYDSTGVFCQTKLIYVSGNEINKNISGTFSYEGDAYTYKVMLWENFASMKPIENALSGLLH